jgi:FdrA protein
MVSGFVIRKNQYYDSVFLMTVNRRISEVKGVLQTAVLMGSPANKVLFANIGVQDAQIDAAQPNDLVVAVVAERQSVLEDVLGRVDEWLNAVEETAPAARQAHTLEDGLAVQPHADLAVISIPGEYAAREARRALDAGLNVFVFSDNVTIADELEIKQLAAQKGLLVMGPDCGTSIIGGSGIGFANLVRKGAVGVIGGAGTGLQEFTSQVHNAGLGISHAIGTGSHDLSAQIGGLTTFAALEMLEADENTKVIALVSKPPDPGTLERLLQRIAACSKPVIGCLLGVNLASLQGRTNFQPAHTIDEAVLLSVSALGTGLEAPGEDLTPQERELFAREMAGRNPQQNYLRGIFAGGTFTYQAQQILREKGLRIHSNSPFDKADALEHPDRSVEHTIVDMGADFYMVGRPHPMIDGTMRKQRILQESQDAGMAVLFLDFILGYNASLDPVGELVDAVRQAKEMAVHRGGNLSVVASLCGTAQDPQNLNLQEKILREAGVHTFHSNAQAASACARLLGKG